MTDSTVRVFVPSDSCVGGWLNLVGEEADRVYLLGARPGDHITVLDDSGWELTVAVDHATPESVGGAIVGRQLARERRTKVTLYHGLLHPSDLRRLLAGATGLGVVRFLPIITDTSLVPALGADGRPEGESDVPRLVRHAAETSGRGRRPSVGQPRLMPHALDEALRSGTVLVLDPAGEPLIAALDDRPFSINLFCPPPAGFSADELARAEARGARIVRAETAGPDPVGPALAVLETIYAALEEDEP